MDEDNRSHEDEWLKKELRGMFGVTNDEEAVNKTPDTRPGPDEQADRNLTLMNKLHALLTLWFCVNGLTSAVSANLLYGFEQFNLRTCESEVCGLV